MPIKYVQADIVDLIKTSQYDVVFHQANCMCRMGSGVAKTLKDAFPELYEADKKTAVGDYNKLGNYTSTSITDSNDHTTYLINIYGQYTYGYDQKQYTDYDALFLGMKKVRYRIDAMRELAAYPRDWRPSILTVKLGCGLGGANWGVVSSTLEEIFRDCDVTVCELPTKN